MLLISEGDLPHHFNHEAKGAELVEALCQRFRVPNEYRDIAVVTARFHSDCHQIKERRASTVIKVFEKMDAFRKPERIELFVLACEADSRGRQGKENVAYPQAALFRDYFGAANGVDTTAIASAAQADGLGGEAIGSRIHEARVNAVKQIMKHDS